MNTYTKQTQLYKILAHSTRLAILEALRGGEQCVCHMEALFGLRQAHISQHLMVLRDAGLVADRRDGWNIFYRVVKPEIYAVVDAMNIFAGEQANGLASRRKPCPCPKCNAGALTNRSETPDISFDQVKTIV